MARIGIVFTTLFVTTGLLSACATSYSQGDRDVVDRAISTGDESELRGKTRYLYLRKLRQLKVEDAARRRDPSELDYIEIAMYEKELARVKKLEIVEAREKVELEEQQRLAAIEAEEERKAKALAVAMERINARDRARKEKLEQAEEFERKIAEPLHPEWTRDMDMLATYFKSKGFEPAPRLVDVYARTMQFLVHATPSSDQFNNFYEKFSDVEKQDHSRMFHDDTGVELLAKFWSDHERADRVPPISAN